MQQDNTTALDMLRAVAHAPDLIQRPEGGQPFQLVSGFSPSGDQPAAIAALIVVYAAAAWINTRIPLTGVEMRPLRQNPERSVLANTLMLVPDFWQCNKRLWNDRLGQIASLSELEGLRDAEEPAETAPEAAAEKAKNDSE